ENERKLLRFARAVDDHEHASRLEDCENADDGFHTVVEIDCDAIAAAHAGGDEHIGQAVGHRVYLRISQPLAVADERDLIRRALGAVMQEVLDEHEVLLKRGVNEIWPLFVSARRPFCRKIAVTPSASIWIRQNSAHGGQRNFQFDSAAAGFAKKLNTWKAPYCGMGVHPGRVSRHHRAGAAPQRVLRQFGGIVAIWKRESCAGSAQLRTDGRQALFDLGAGVLAGFTNEDGMSAVMSANGKPAPAQTARLVP